MFYRAVSKLYGPQGEMVEELVLFDAETDTKATPEQIAAMQNPEPAVVYVGSVLIPIGVKDAEGNTIDVRPQEMKFQIEASSRKEAFDGFEKSAQDLIDQLKKRQEAKSRPAGSGLIVPNAAQSEAINKLKLVSE